MKYFIRKILIYISIKSINAKVLFKENIMHAQLQMKKNIDDINYHVLRMFHFDRELDRN